MKGTNTTTKSIVYILLAIFLVEIAYFNFPFWESLFYEKSGSYSYTVDNETNRSVIEIQKPSYQINNIFLYIDDYPEDRPIPVKITFTDEANINLELAETEVIKSIPESLYIKVSPDGKISNLKIEIDNSIYKFDPSTIQFCFNETRPLSINLLRVCGLLAASLIIYFFFISPKLFNRKMFDPDNKIEHTVFPTVLLTAIVLIAVWISTVMLFSDDGSAGIQNAYKTGNVEAIYSYQSDSFLDGHAYLNIDPPGFLSRMEDPYNPAARDEFSKETGEYTKLDFAYYKGKYYCYYGVVPVVLFYLPVKLLTGLPVKNAHFILLTGIVFLLAAIKLVVSLCRRINKNISLGAFIILYISFVFGSISFCCAYNTGIYTVPNISALAFVTGGLACWLGASENKTKGELSRASLVLGSICMILAVGCRPTSGVFIFSAFPVFEREIKNKLFFTKKNVVNTMCVILPVLIIGIVLLYYNYIRFGNPFDFGSKYNMSDVNLNGKRWGIRMLGVGIFEYLFQPPYINADFPYFYSIYTLKSISRDYMGYMFFSPTFGGYFFLAPVSVFLFHFRKQKRSLREKNLYSLVVFSIIAAIIMLIIDIEVAGIALRYQLDFSVLFILAAIIVICDKTGDPELIKNEGLYKVFMSSVCVLTMLTVLINLGIMISDNQFYPLKYLSPNTYYYLKYLIFSPR